jgi:Uma2 family endonuclease
MTPKSLANARPLTYDELAAMPEDGKRYELVNGELFERGSNSPRHQWFMGQCLTRFSNHVDAGELGEVLLGPLDVKLSPYTVLQPDFLYVSRQRWHRIVGDWGIDGAPDLVAEALAPQTELRDRVIKAAIYATFGVSEYWLIDIDRESIHVQTLQDGIFVPVASVDGVARSVVLPGFEVAPEEIFTVPDWMRELNW